MLTGALIYRPWFENVLLSLLLRTWWPLARVASTAVEKDYDAEALCAALPNLRRGGLLNGALKDLRARMDDYEAAEAAWRAAAFGGGEPEAIAALEVERRRAAWSLMQAPTLFFLVRGARRTPPIRFDVAAASHTPPPPPAGPVGPIVASTPFVRAGVREIWWRYRSPMDGEGWARVREPADAPVRATLVSLHGWAVENEMLQDGRIDPYAPLIKHGVRIVQPEAPWHGRRRARGWGGGEPAMGRSPWGMRDLMATWTEEVAMITRATRADGPVVWTGISMGALTAQSGAGRVSADARPDGLLLVTTSGDLVDVSMRGSLAVGLGLTRAVAQAGWTEPMLAPVAATIEPAAEAPIDPQRIVLALGDADTITPFAGGLALAKRWGVPPENVLVHRRGHITRALALKRDAAALAALSRLLGID